MTTWDSIKAVQALLAERRLVRERAQLLDEVTAQFWLERPWTTSASSTSTTTHVAVGNIWTRVHNDCGPGVWSRVNEHMSERAAA